MAIHIDTVTGLANQILRALEEKGRVVIAIAGAPGAGKSTIANSLINELSKSSIRAKSLPQDGFHYYRAELEKFEDPDEAFRRRGAPFTFNADAFINTVKRLQTSETVYAPSFDHSKKDPVENAIVIEPEVQVILIEGNYVGLIDEPWCSLASLTDQLWMIQQDNEMVRERLIARHLSSGVCASLQEAIDRTDGSDWKNACYIIEHSRNADVIFQAR